MKSDRRPLHLLFLVGACAFGVAATACAQSAAPPSSPERTDPVQQNAQKTITPDKTPVPPEVRRSLPEYIHYMAVKLDFYFTFEETGNLQGGRPSIQNIEDFDADVDIATVDALAAHLDSLENVTAFRSARNPKVIHLVADDLLIDGYVMDRRVSVEKYAGGINRLADRLGEALRGKIQSKRGGVFPPLWGDGVTQVQVSADQEIVRDVLTSAVPLDRYRRRIWVAEQRDATSPVEIAYMGLRTVEEPIDGK